ncbi:class I SAM-dependent methyltransferase [Nocardioides cavernae]|nr:class I SAM-dependent methyltransferase [Nocardioides cavernae]
MLHDRLLAVGYGGVDISEVAVQALQGRELPGAEFHAVDAETFTPRTDVDILVFNESLAYFKDPAG